jgi:hypothetical protein
MQNLFALETPWHTPWMVRVLPVVTRIAQERPRDTILTRFIPPQRPDQMPGTWQRYYERWRDLTLERIDPHWLDLVAPLTALSPPAEIVDKRFYSPFSEPRLADLLRRRGTDALVITGAETDVCVLAAVLDARRSRLPRRACDGCDMQLVGRNPRRTPDSLPKSFRSADRNDYQRGFASQLELRRTRRKPRGRTYGRKQGMSQSAYCLRMR